MGANNTGKSSALSAINLLAQTIQNRRSADSPIVLNGVHETLGTYTDTVSGNNPRTKMGLDFGFNGFDASFEVKYRTQRREIELTRFSLSRDNREIYRYSVRKDSFDKKIFGKSIETIIPGVKKGRPNINWFWPYESELYFARSRYEELPENKLLVDAGRTLMTAERRLFELFSNFDSLSPFRTQPERAYLYSGEAPETVGRNGDHGILLIANDSSKRGSQQIGILQHINEWFQVTGIAKGIKVKSLTPRHFEICIIDFNGGEHNICDVGFGCSQVLPVLTGGLNLFLRGKQKRRRAQPMFVVQEPEIHLHPNAQAALGSYFVGLSNLGGQIFIETHSDHLVLRIARHIARKELRKEDVAIYFIEDNRGEKEINRIEFDDDGAFSPSWPGGFLPQRKSESLALAKDRISETKQEMKQLEFPYLEKTEQ